MWMWTAPLQPGCPRTQGFGLAGRAQCLGFGALGQHEARLCGRGVGPQGLSLQAKGGLCAWGHCMQTRVVMSRGVA